MNSLLSANYQNFNVSLIVNLEFESSPEIVTYFDNFAWPHGEKIIKMKSNHSGLEEMIVNAWNPYDKNEYSFFFEDDIELHKDFFSFTLKILRSLKSFDNLAGISLITPKFDEVNKDTGVWLPSKLLKESEKLFLFQIPSSWGALYFPEPWKNFRKYYSQRIKWNVKDLIPSSRINGWTKSWKRYYMEFMLFEPLFMIYPHFTNITGYAVNHREQGTHVNSTVKIDYYTSEFVNEKESSDFLRNFNSSKYSYPVINFYHLKTSLKNVLTFSRMLKDRKNKLKAQTE